MYGYHWEKIDVGHYWDLKVKQRRRRRQQERQKTIGSEIGKTTNFARASRFLVHFFAVGARLRCESA